MLESFGDGFGALAAAVVMDHDVVAMRREGFYGGSANSAARAGDQTDRVRHGSVRASASLRTYRLHDPLLVWYSRIFQTGAERDGHFGGPDTDDGRVEIVEGFLGEH